MPPPYPTPDLRAEHAGYHFSCVKTPLGVVTEQLDLLDGRFILVEKDAAMNVFSQELGICGNRVLTVEGRLKAADFLKMETLTPPISSTTLPTSSTKYANLSLTSLIFRVSVRRSTAPRSPSS